MYVHLTSSQCIIFHDQSLAEFIMGAMGLKAIHLAAMFGQTNVVKWLINRRYSLPAVACANGSRPLHFAAAQGHVDTVMALLKVPSSPCSAKRSYGPSRNSNHTHHHNSDKMAHHHYLLTAWQHEALLCVVVPSLASPSP